MFDSREPFPQVRKMKCFPAFVALLLAGCVADTQTEYAGRAVNLAHHQIEGTSPEYDSPPKLLSGRIPEYPLAARIRHELAVVRATFVVGADGGVHDLRIEKSPPRSLAYTTAQALSAWRFKPAQKNGQAVPAKVSISIDFFRSG